VLRRNTESNICTLATLAQLPPVEKSSPARVQVHAMPSERFYIEDQPSTWLYKDEEVCTCDSRECCTCPTRIVERDISKATPHCAPILRKADSPRTQPKSPATSNTQVPTDSGSVVLANDGLPLEPVAPNRHLILRRKQTGLSGSSGHLQVPGAYPRPRPHQQHDVDNAFFHSGAPSPRPGISTSGVSPAEDQTQSAVAGPACGLDDRSRTTSSEKPSEGVESSGVVPGFPVIESSLQDVADREGIVQITSATCREGPDDIIGIACEDASRPAP
jgi:hypothetical protein